MSSDEPSAESSVPTEADERSAGTVCAAGTPDRVVAIGSSAGGLEALSALLQSLPPDQAITYIIAQHLAAHHESQLVPLLSRASALPVVVATDGAPLTPGTILVSPPNVDLEVGRDQVQLSEPGAGAGPNPSIDVLMRSAAASWGEQAIGVVLSGTGSDGSAGLRALRDAGGLTIVQRPDTAQFDAMPQAAIATGATDLILAPSEIGPALSETPTLLVHLDAPSATAPIPGGTDAVADTLAALHFSTGLDFTDYKRGTLERQIARRQALTGITDPGEYRELIADGGEEAKALASCLLVTVTSFFRDPAAWDGLRVALVDAWEERDPRRQVRVWVPGCATGEEAYSAAMLVADVLGAGADLPSRLKLFATDLSDAALDVGRRGQYSDDAVAAIPAERRDRWLRHTDTGWEVAPALRDAVIFARHNVAQDPPFPGVDLICLRNTLIYFRAPLQTRVLSYCHFSLVQDGLLFLGSSERPGGPNGLFDVIDDANRIYKRSATAFPAPLPVPQQTSYPAPEPAAEKPTSTSRQLLRDALINELSPPALVLDLNDDVVEVIGDVSTWCWVAPGQPNTSVVALLREELRAGVQNLLIQARHLSANGRSASQLTPNGDARLTVRPLGQPGSDWTLLTFSPIPAETRSASSSAGRNSEGIDTRAAASSGNADSPERLSDLSDEQLRQVQAELDYTRSALQSTVEELSTSNEELRAMNEELQASAEELQASGEEVQATNEELQATNEELTVLNTELRERGSDLADVNEQLQNIARSLTSGMVVVDRELRITQFTPLAVRLFVLIDDDLGKPLTSIVTTSPVPDLARHLRESLELGTPAVVDVRGQDTDFMVSFQPYLQHGENTAGVIVVVTDVTELMTARRELAEVEYRYRMVAENSTDAVFLVDRLGAVVWASPAVKQVLGYEPADLVGKRAVDGVFPDDLDKLSAIQDRIERGASTAHCEIRVRAHGDQYLWMSTVTGPAFDSNGNVVGRIAALRDIHEQVLTRDTLAVQANQLELASSRLQETQRELEEAQRIAHVGSWTFELASGEVWWSHELFVMHGLDPAQVAPSASEQAQLFTRQSWEQLSSALAETTLTGEPYSLELAMVRPDGSYGWMDARGEAQRDASGAIVGLRGVAMDITGNRLAADALIRSEQTFRLAMDGAPQGMAVIGLHLAFRNVNPMLCTMLGHDESWLLEHTLREVVHPDDLEADLKERDQLLSGEVESQVHERRWLRADGTYLWVVHSTALQRDIDGTPLFYVTHVQDSSEAHHVSELLASRANHDPLTGLLNRVQLEARLAELTDQLSSVNERLAVLFCDLDHFKRINDQHGHQAGDDTLKATAERITDCLRSEDIVGRFGGDEFVVVLNNVSGVSDALAVAEKIRAAVCQALPIPNVATSLTISIGVGMSTPDIDSHRLLRNADSALYAAKQAGRDRVEVYSSVSIDEAQAQIKAALDRGEFRPWFQPIVDLPTGNVVGHEALARWEHPDQTVSLPGDFLSKAELSDAICLLDQAMLKQVIDALNKVDGDTFVSVNVSSVTLASPGFAEHVIAAVSRNGTDPSRLHLEFTETALLAVTSRVADVMRRIADTGIAWYVDDFGTGFSSIAHLRDLPISGLKLDLSFTAGIETDDPVCQHLARGLAGLADGLDLDTVAEGIETQKQADFMRSNGWQQGQGWLYGRAASGLS